MLYELKGLFLIFPIMFIWATTALTQDEIPYFDINSLPDVAISSAPIIKEPLVANPLKTSRDKGSTSTNGKHLDESANAILKHYFILQASPLKFDRTNKQKDINFGLSYNFRRKNDNFRLSYERESFSVQDPISAIKVSQDKNNAEMLYDYYFTNHEWSYFFLNTYKNRKEGGMHVVKDQYRIGPAGIKHTFLDIKHLDEFSISYIPLYEFAEFEVEDASNILNPVINTHIRKGIRNSFRFRAKASTKDEKVKFMDQLFYRPVYSFSKDTLDFHDVDFENEMSTSIYILGKLSLTYTNTITWDRRLSDINRIPSTNITHKITFAYEINL